MSNLKKHICFFACLVLSMAQNNKACSNYEKYYISSESSKFKINPLAVRFEVPMKWFEDRAITIELDDNLQASELWNDLQHFTIPPKFLQQMEDIHQSLYEYSLPKPLKFVKKEDVSLIIQDAENYQYTIFKQNGCEILCYFPIKNNVFISEADLVKIEKKDREAEGMEWYEFYSRFVNLSITFNKCVGHIGEYEWCRSVSFDDFQMRVYVLQDEIKYLKEKILDTVARIEKMQLNRYLSSKDKLIIIKEPKISFSYTDDQKAWNCLQISTNLHYYDYQGISKIDYYWKKFKNEWIVFVFMYNKTEDNAKNLDFILDSVKFN